MKRTERFTLIELLVVIAIIATLAALLLPSLAATKVRAKGIQCVSNQRQCLLATISYTADANGWTPPADSNVSGWASSLARGWYVNLLYNGYLPNSCVESFFIDGGGRVWLAKLRYPNVQSCPVLQPPGDYDPWMKNITYAPRWPAALGSETANLEGEVWSYSNGGSTVLERLKPNLPYLADTTCTTDPQSTGGYWQCNVQMNNIVISLSHQRKGGMGYGDGHVALVSQAELSGVGITKMYSP